MALINSTQVIQNVIALIAIAAIAFLIYSKMDKGKAKSTIGGIKRLFGGGKDE